MRCARAVRRLGSRISKPGSPRSNTVAVPAKRYPLRMKTSTKLTSMRGFALRFRIVPGERISPNAIVRSSSTAKVPFGETFGVPSGAAVATNPRRCSSMTRFMSGVSISVTSNTDWGSIPDRPNPVTIEPGYQCGSGLLAIRTEKGAKSGSQQAQHTCGRSVGASTEPHRGNAQIATDTFGEVSEFDAAAELIGD